MRLLFLLLIHTLLFGGVDRHLAYPKTIDADAIAKQVYFVNHQLYLKNQLIKAKARKSILVVKHQKGKEPKSFRANRFLNNDYTDGIIKSKDIVIFTSGKLKGVGILIKEYVDESKSLEVLMWLPALRKVRRMAEPSKNVGYSAADIAFIEETKLRRLSQDTFVLLGTQKMKFQFKQLELKPSEITRYTKDLPTQKHQKKAEVYLLKATPKEDAWYDYRIDYIDTKHFTTYRTNIYKANKIIKIIDRQWKKVKGIDDPRAYMWNYWYSINPETGFETVNYIPHSIIKNNDMRIKNAFWSTRTLRKIRK